MHEQLSTANTGKTEEIDAHDEAIHERSNQESNTQSTEKFLHLERRKILLFDPEEDWLR